MKVIVNKYLNARSNAPSTAASIPYYRIPGEVLEIDDIEIGTEINGNSVWYHCFVDGCFYWSGGIELSKELLQSRRHNGSFSQKEQLKIYQSAANELASTYNTLPGFKGIGVGYKQTEKVLTAALSLIFYVNVKLAVSKEIPKSILYRGVSLITDVLEIKGVGLQNLEPDTNPPYLMGGSIAEVDKGTEISHGTRTLFVEKHGKKYLLTCFHVACSSIFAKGGRSLKNQNIKVAIPSQDVSPNATSTLCSVVEGGMGPDYEYALIEVQEGLLENYMPDHFFNGCYNKEELAEAFLLKRPLIKFGAKTQTTKGSFVGYFSTALEVDKKHKIFMSGLVTATRMSKKGDSGAPVIDATNDKLIGFIIAGIGDTSFILPFAQLKDLHITPKCKTNE